MLEVGQPAPDFTLRDHNGEKVTLSHFRDQKAVVLSWHVLSFTSG